MTQLEMLNAQAEAERAHRDYAVATIVSAEGSTPRESGKMLVFIDGSALGTIGGGEVERLAREDALHYLKTGQNKLKRYTLKPDGIGMTCGGDMSVFIEVFKSRPQLVVCGAGHVGGALLRMAQLCGYETTLLDTRPDQLIADKIAAADRYIHAESFLEGMRELDIQPGAFIVIATFGHNGDADALAGSLDKQAAYIGMVGSRSKVAALFAGLRAQGVNEETLESIYTPVGLDLGGETPEDIALCVMAEIAKVRHGRSAKHLRDCDHK